MCNTHIQLMVTWATEGHQRQQCVRGGFMSALSTDLTETIWNSTPEILSCSSGDTEVHGPSRRVVLFLWVITPLGSNDLLIGIEHQISCIPGIYIDL